MRYLLTVLVTFITLQLSSQNYLVSAIPKDLLENANAVIRSETKMVFISSFDKVIVRDELVVTILNKKGSIYESTYTNYDKSKIIKKLEAYYYNKEGLEVKKIKKKDFIDVNSVDGFSLYTDDRVLYSPHTMHKYPYTVKFIEEYESDFTVFLPAWNPIKGFNLSVEKSTYNFINNSDVDIKIKENNFEAFNVNSEPVKNYYSLINTAAINKEILAPLLSSFTPTLKIALKKFQIKGVTGYNNNWQDFGKWMNDELLLGTQDLPDLVKTEIKQLTDLAVTDLEKAKIVYDYVQRKTRYISVQVGIGGWKPMQASDVDRLGYGDCKALTNYTKALLDVIGVKSYYTIVYGGSKKIDLDKGFSSLQGNHVILTLDNKNNYKWLECTSQTSPFAFTANFTDDRNVLLIKPNGGEIFRTKDYSKENLKKTIIDINLNEDLSVTGHLKINSSGIFYSKRGFLNRLTKDKKTTYYKNDYKKINNFNIINQAIINNKEPVSLVETISFSVDRFARKASNFVLFEFNRFDKIKLDVVKNNNRVLPFVIDRSYLDSISYNYKMPLNYTIEELPENIEIITKYGSYTRFVTVNKNIINIVRSLKINSGSFSSKEYETYYEFCTKINKEESSKIIFNTPL